MQILAHLVALAELQRGLVVGCDVADLGVGRVGGRRAKLERARSR